MITENVKTMVLYLHTVSLIVAEYIFKFQFKQYYDVYEEGVLLQKLKG